MRITIQIDTDNAAWEDDPRQMDKVLSQAGNWLSWPRIEGGCSLVDINGNNTGNVSVGSKPIPTSSMPLQDLEEDDRLPGRWEARLDR